MPPLDSGILNITSLILNLLNEKKRVYSDLELSQLQKNHEYGRRKMILDILSFLFVGSVTLVTVAFFYEFWTNEALRLGIMEKIAENIVGIIFFALAIFGIRKQQS